MTTRPGQTPDDNYVGKKSQGGVRVTAESVFENFRSAVFGVNPTVGYGGEEASGQLPGGVYFSGDVSSPYHDPNRPKSGLTSVNHALSMLAELPRDQMINWKNRLYDAGVYDPAMYSKGQKPRQIGLLDDDDRAAFRSLILTSLTAPNGATTQEVLEAMQQDSPYSAKNNYGRQPYQSTTQVSDPATIRKYAQTAGKELLGRDLTDAEEARLVSKLSGQERQGATNTAQKVANLQASGQSGVVISENVDVAARAEQQVEAEHGEEAQAKKFADGLDILMKMIGAG